MSFLVSSKSSSDGVDNREVVETYKPLERVNAGRVGAKADAEDARVRVRKETVFIEEHRRQK